MIRRRALPSQQHLISMDQADRRAVLRIAESFAPLDEAACEPVLQKMRAASHAAGELVLSIGDPEPAEYFVLEGILKPFVGDAEGREVTLAFHVGPSVVMPAITRM